LNPTEPPLKDLEIDEQTGDAYAIEKVARFVSLIPFKEDLKKFEDMPDLYCTNQEFLDLGEGDFEEHAILMCNYFNWIDQKWHPDKPDMKSYLLYGDAVPEGQTTYVLRRNVKKGHAEIWSPVTGECYFFECVTP